MAYPPPFHALRPIVLGSLSLAAVLLTGCMEQAAPVAETPAPVRVVAVTSESEASQHRFTGVIRPRFETDLGFRIEGKIIERLVSVGDQVRQGQVLARLDDTDLKLQLEAREAQLLSTRTGLATADANLSRQKKLFAKGWVAQARLDDATSVKDEAQARVTQAERDIDVLRNQIGYADLVATFDGIITAVPAETGEVMSVGQPAIRLARSDAFDAVINIPEQQLATLDGVKASAELWPSGGASFPVTLRETAAEADPLTRTFELRFAIDNPPVDVRLGKTISVTLETPQSAGKIRLPLSAVMNDAAGPMVWVVTAAGDAIERRAVNVEAFQQDSVVISSGLKPDERVVSLGVHQLDAGRKVRIVETQAGSMAGLAAPQTKAVP